jgi:hypothetical protein
MVDESLAAAATGQANARPLPELDQLVLDFESFGDNCEFGLVQRQAGAEPLGLLRFSFTPMPSLLRALESRFAGVADLDKIEIMVAKNKEFIVKIRDYDFVYHSGRKEGEIEIETLRRDEAVKLGFLIRRLTGTLRSGEKIFVRKGQNSSRQDETEKLLAAMRAYGPATLLWVLPADADHPPGSVALVAAHLICGRIDRFAPYDDAHSIGFSTWIDICRGAHLLWRSDWGVGTQLRAPARHAYADNLLLPGPAAPQVTLQSRGIETAGGGSCLRYAIRRAAKSSSTERPTRTMPASSCNSPAWRRGRRTRCRSGPGLPRTRACGTSTWSPAANSCARGGQIFASPAGNEWK